MSYRRSSLERWMRWMMSRRFFFLLLSVVALGAFFPAFAPLPALSSFASTPRRDFTSDAPRFEIYDDEFWKDGQPFQIIGGDLHYFRVLPQYWEDRLLRAKALGLNAIQTYVPWNLHEPKRGEWVFEGISDLESFLKLAQKLGFLVMLRPGPYICAEWDFGGFPAWLLAVEPAMTLRSSDPSFLNLVERWWGVLLPKITPLLYGNGGPIVMVQIENEYGSYGEDKKYLQHLVTLARKLLGEDIILYTTDGGTRETLRKGTLKGADVFSAVDFSTGEDPWSIFELQKEFNAPGRSPPLSAEFYTGWLTHWGEKIAETNAAFTAKALESILSKKGSAVLYMAHGGTNFGFFSGANTGENESMYKPDLTSYDYDAPIKESGDVDNPKFKAIRAVIQRYSRVSLPSVPSDSEKGQYGDLKVQQIISFFEVLNIISDPKEVIEAENPMKMEFFGQMFGFLLYMSEYSAKENVSILSIPKVHDRAQVFISCMSVDSGAIPTFIGIIERWSNRELTLPDIKCVSNTNLFVLVENLGRVNYGSYLHDSKGILSTVSVDNAVLKHWKMLPISFQNLTNLFNVNPIQQVAESRAEIRRQGPQFCMGQFTIDPTDQVKDTFLSFRGWSKGIAFVNNFNVGRFWPSFGPQCDLYIPAPILHHGENVVVVLELDDPHPELTLEFVDKRDFTCGAKLH
ncbi:beta-galactosidase 17 [Aristolochia californica]|uniref:beta-galactosidase 17 n=1 Tax=Aristolochia californica TaxID=171875 RepID=UPI0035DBEA42